jgi:hypothetical protein
MLRMLRITLIALTNAAAFGAVGFFAYQIWRLAGPLG